MIILRSKGKLVLWFRDVHTTANLSIQAIHKELEREVRVEELPVDITSNEERWALRWVILIHYFDTLGADHAFLRLVNMLASLKCIMDDGLTVSTKFVIIVHVLLSLKLSAKCLFLELYATK